MENFVLSLVEGKEQDVDEIYRIHTSAIRQVCASHYGAKDIELWAGKQTTQTYVASLKNGNIFVAKDQRGKLFGFLHYILQTAETCRDGQGKELRDRAQNQVEIRGLYVDPNFVRKGVGRRLMEEVVKLAKKNEANCLTVSASLNSVPFYKKMGFREVEVRAHEITCQCTVKCMSMVKQLCN